jgi:hypothetical protein
MSWFRLQTGDSRGLCRLNLATQNPLAHHLTMLNPCCDRLRLSHYTLRSMGAVVDQTVTSPRYIYPMLGFLALHYGRLINASVRLIYPFHRLAKQLLYLVV